MWDLQGNILADLNKHEDEVAHVAFSHGDSMIVTSSYDGTAKLWDLEGKLLRDLKKPNSYVISAAFSPNDHRILTASRDGTSKLWDIEEDNLLIDLNKLGFRHPNCHWN